VYIRLVDERDVTWQNRAHFFGQRAAHFSGRRLMKR